VSARPLGAAVVASLCLAACGGDDDDGRLLDTGPVETGIARGIERDRPGTQVVSVTCPDDVKLEKGGTFTCRVKGSKSGEDAVATVTQEDDEGRVRYRVP
jgi:Domain of unknown function (DUF4333)